jgi:hypothetical protein
MSIDMGRFHESLGGTTLGIFGTGWLFFNFLLYKSMFIAYFMAFVLSCETIGSIRVLGIEYKFFSVDIVVLCVLPWVLAVRTRSGSTFHPLALMSSIRPSYFIVFSSILSGEYLSLQYVNSMNYTLNVGLGWFAGSALYGWLRMQSMSGLNLALHWHLCVWLL